MGFVRRNWKLLVGLIGLGIAREVLQRRKTISLQDKVVLNLGRESESTMTRSFLTRLGQQAAREYNEQPEA